MDENSNEGPIPSTSTAHPTSQHVDEDALFRELSRPPPIQGVENWGIPPAPTTPCDPALEAKIQRFKFLKLEGKHFNDSLMANKAFRNPHIYAKLVEFVDVDEMGTKFSKNVWDPMDLDPEWYADRIAAHQKERSEKTTASQASGKRSHIDFSSSSSSRQHAPVSSVKDHDARYKPYPGQSSSASSKDKSRYDYGKGDERDRRKEGGREREKDRYGRDWRR